MVEIAMTHFLLPLVTLIASIVVFFIAARGQYAQFGIWQRLLRVLVALPLLISAVGLHFMRTNEATSMLPPLFSAPAFFVLLTGVLEILGAIGLFVRRTGRSAALWIAILMVVIFPVNVFVAGQTFAGVRMPGVPARLAMQLVYIWLVLLAGYGMPRRRRPETP